MRGEVGEEEEVRDLYMKNEEEEGEGEGNVQNKEDGSL